MRQKFLFISAIALFLESTLAIAQPSPSSLDGRWVIESGFYGDTLGINGATPNSNGRASVRFHYELAPRYDGSLIGIGAVGNADFCNPCGASFHTHGPYLFAFADLGDKRLSFGAVQMPSDILRPQLSGAADVLFAPSSPYASHLVARMDTTFGSSDISIGYNRVANVLEIGTRSEFIGFRSTFIASTSGGASLSWEASLARSLGGGVSSILLNKMDLMLIGSGSLSGFSGGEVLVNFHAARKVELGGGLIRSSGVNGYTAHASLGLLDQMAVGAKYIGWNNGNYQTWIGVNADLGRY